MNICGQVPFKSVPYHALVKVADGGDFAVGAYEVAVQRLFVAQQQSASGKPPPATGRSVLTSPLLDLHEST